MVYGPTRSDFRKKWLKPLSIVMKNFGKKNRVDASKIFDFAPISSKQMISPRTVEKPLNILKKRVVFSIWRAEKWKFIAGDWIKRFSLIVRNFSQDFCSIKLQV